MKRIGNGRMAIVYKINDHQVLKLFNQGISKKYALDEFNRCKHINELGISSPKAYEIVEKDERNGILYQFIKGETYLDMLMSNGSLDSNPGVEMAKVHLDIHKSKSSLLMDINDVIKRSLKYADLDENIKEKILAYIIGLPKGNTVCHLDFHPDNLIKDGNDFTVIDWANAVKGCKEADVYNTVLSISSGTVPPGTPREVENLINTLRKELASQYLEYYLQNSDITKEDVFRWELPILVYRLGHGISEERNDLTRKISELAKSI